VTALRPRRAALRKIKANDKCIFPDSSVWNTNGNALHISKVKVKPSHYRPAIGPEDSRRLRLPDFKTIAK